MSVFNNESRTKNALKVSIIGGVTNILKVILGTGYRTIFVFLLSEVYLGINGLFTNVLQILSLAELGITTAIAYRFYEPISREDVHYVGMLMNFFGKVYRIIALVILMLGLSLMPFLNFLINSSDSLPADVNIYVVYILFLLNTVVSYIFSYKLTLLTADQKNYAFSIFDLILTIIRYGVQILTLCITRNYTLTLTFSILTILLVNYIGSKWTEKQYKEVFQVKEMLPKDQQKLIFEDTKACVYHKVGTTVLTGTDNAVLTKMVSLAATGIYSNYSMVLTYVQSLVSQMMGNFTASVGNAIQTMSEDEYYSVYKKTNFSCFWISSVVTVGVYATVDDFVTLWLGEKFALDLLTTIILCIQLYLTLIRTISSSFVNAAGLFVKDRIRPLIEATLNLVISIVLTGYLGISGVFLGTIISMLLTVQWREPFILYKYLFKRKAWDYWKRLLMFTSLTVLTCVVISTIKFNLLFIKLNWGILFGEGLVAVTLINLLLLAFYIKTEEFSFLINIVREILSKVFRKTKIRSQQ